ncbi:hypothetical protein MUA02_20100 [Enterobacteriaceae bacterium H20N1]|uniref:Uncharacterized protein n=1 Tax=Dryocola boscaweniae TaxID=2925397 RepID=A0A9X2WCT8_9ENTR|nr:hypothetical protein [Dryocola boscaweniae]MCT4704159.1 hypothetical protein [Dryocola boscaweniae]MCT4721327.1 hypothetical protein [Dryocola boscaweniae]
MALICLAPVIRYLPGSGMNGRAEKSSWREIFLSKPMQRLAVISFISGTASAAWWSFGPEILHNHSDVDSSTTSMLWMVSGGAGILAVLTGAVTAFIGMSQLAAWRNFYGRTACSVRIQSRFLMVAISGCGAGYVILSGILLACATSSAKKSPSSGVGVAFFMLAAGRLRDR